MLSGAGFLDLRLRGLAGFPDLDTRLRFGAEVEGASGSESEEDEAESEEEASDWGMLKVTGEGRRHSGCTLGNEVLVALRV